MLNSLSFPSHFPSPSSCNTQYSCGFYQFSSERPRASVVRFSLYTDTRTNFHWSIALQGLSLSPSNPFHSLSLLLSLFISISIYLFLFSSFLSRVPAELLLSLSSLISTKGMERRSEKGRGSSLHVQYHTGVCIVVRSRLYLSLFPFSLSLSLSLSLSQRERVRVSRFAAGPWETAHLRSFH